MFFATLANLRPKRSIVEKTQDALLGSAGAPRRFALQGHRAGQVTPGVEQSIDCRAKPLSLDFLGDVSLIS